MKIKSFLKDIGGASRVTAKRQHAFDSAASVSEPYDPIGKVAALLHPGFIKLEVIEIREASPTAKTIRFRSDSHIPYFKAGQFLNLRIKTGESLVNRPYSISSAPYETRTQTPYVEITVRKPRENGFIADYLFDKVRLHDVFDAEVRLGEFYHDSIRDSRNVVALAGGSGITPFVSMAKEIKNGTLDFNLTIIYGSVSYKDIILYKELENCVCDKVRVVHVLSGDNPDWKGEKGFLTSEIIKKYSEGDTSYFVCGPQVMYTFIKKELDALHIPERRIRFEVFGQTRDITAFEGFPESLRDKEFKLTIRQGIAETTIPAKATESIATAIERSGMKIHTACRSGSCGFCRIKVLEGRYFVCPTGDGRRKADRDFNYVHACSTYPLDNLTIKMNI